MTKKNIIILGSVLVVCLAAATSMVCVLWLPLSSDGQEFTVTKGDSLSAIAQQLKQDKLIRSTLAFRLAAKVSGRGSQIKAGNYLFAGRFNTWSLLSSLNKGPQLSEEKTVLVKEGANNKTIEEELLKNQIITDGSFLKLASTLIADLPESYRQQYSFLAEAPQQVDLEGFLFPDTYRLYAQDGGQALVDKMLSNFDRKLTATMRADIKAQGKSLYEVLVLASIVEKEVRSTDDMKTVAGIFYNRLKNGQRLESCATLAYILGVNKAQYSYEDTQTDSPFNTYRNDGLPPTPIGNPGIRAIEAAIYPNQTDYQFFLTDPATKQTVWARTFEEHVRNKQQYLQ